jgi:hypothetical protein
MMAGMTNLRRRWATAVATAVALAVSLMPSAPAAAANAVFQAGHLNILNSLSRADFVHDLQLITSRADLVGLNEVNGRKDFLRDWADNNGWWFYAPEPAAAANEALLAKKSMFDVLDRGSNFACDTNGPNEVPPARYNNWVKYRHKASGRVVFHINFHANAGIENNGRPEPLPRTDCAEKQFQDIKELAARKKDEGQVIVSGDLNVDFSADRAFGYARFPWKVFEANELPNLRSVYNMLGVKGAGTHTSNRHIDYIYFWRRVDDFRHMWMTDYRIVGDTRSDHNGVVADFAIEL